MEPLETVASFKTRLKAELARRWLENEGISVHVLELPAKDERISSRLIDADVGGAMVRVAREDLERAQSVLVREGCTTDADDALPATAITACPERVSKKTELEESPDTEQDHIARRALLAAIVGLGTFFFLFHLYSLYVLSALDAARGPLSERGRRNVKWAFLIDYVVLGGSLLCGVVLCGGLMLSR